MIVRPGEAVGVAMGRKLLLRMDWGVKAENTGPDAASARARLTTCGVCSRLSSGALLMLFGGFQEVADLGGVSSGREPSGGVV